MSFFLETPDLVGLDAGVMGEDVLFARASTPRIIDIEAVEADRKANRRARDDLLSAAYNSGRYVENFVAESDARGEVASRRLEQIHQATGVQLSNPFTEWLTTAERREMHMHFEGDRDRYLAHKYAKFEAQLQLLAKRFPDHADLITGGGKRIEDEALDFVRETDQEFERALEAGQLTGTERFFLSTAGLLGAAVHDPVQVGSLVLGAAPSAGRSVASRIFQVAATEAVIGAGVETVLQAKTQDLRARVGLKHGFTEALRNVGVATLFGAGGGALIQGGREFASSYGRATGKTLSPEAEATLDRALRDALEETDEAVLVNEVAPFLGRELGETDRELVARAFEADAIDGIYTENAARSFNVDAPDDVRQQLADAAQRYQEDPDRYLPPEVLEAQLAEQEAARVFGIGRAAMTYEDYARIYDVPDDGDLQAGITEDAADRFGLHGPGYVEPSIAPAEPVEMPDPIAPGVELKAPDIDFPDIELDESGNVSNGFTLAPVADDAGNVQYLSPREAYELAGREEIEMAEVVEACPRA